MQKSHKSGGPPRAHKPGSRPAGGTRVAGSGRVGSPDWALDQQQGAGNQNVLGMIGGTRDTQEIANGRPVGRMVEWTPQRGGIMKCRAVFPPGTEVNVGDLGTIADKWGYQVARWEEINDNIHVEFLSAAPEDQFAWGAEVILGEAPPETVLEEVRKDEAEGKSLLDAASGMVGAALLAPAMAAPTAQGPATGVMAAQPATGMPGLGAPTRATTGAAASTGLAASLVAAALGTPAPAKTTMGAPGLAAPGLTTPAAGTASTTQKLGLMEAVLGTGTQQAPQPSPDQQLQQQAQAFVQEAGKGSPDLGALQRIATSVQGDRLFELLGRQLGDRQVENLVRSAQSNAAGQSLLTLLEDKLRPHLGGSAQAAWDAVLDEALVKQAGKTPARKPAAGAAPVKG